MSQIAIVEAFSDLADTRRSAGKHHQQALCFTLFTLAVANTAHCTFQSNCELLKNPM
jgi:hypothetical protein